MQRQITAVIGGVDEWAMRLSANGGNYQEIWLTSFPRFVDSAPNVPCIAGQRVDGSTDCVLLDGSGMQVTFAPEPAAVGNSGFYNSGF